MHKVIIFLGLLFLNLHASAEENLDSQLIYRTAFGGYKDVQILLNKGANANVKNPLGSHVLHIAASRNDENGAKMLELLTKNGADPYEENNKGENAFTIAIADGTPESVEFLLRWRPSYEMQNSLGDNLPSIALRRGNSEVITLVENLKQAQVGELERNTSPENRTRLFNKFSLQTCSEEYMKFYYTQGHEKKPDMQKYEEIATKMQSQTKGTLGDLDKYFSLSRNEMRNVEKASRTRIVQQLAGLGSANYRVRAGVGTNADLQKRCGKIATAISSRATIKRK